MLPFPSVEPQCREESQIRAKQRIKGCACPATSVYDQRTMRPSVMLQQLLTVSYVVRVTACRLSPGVFLLALVGLRLQERWARSGAKGQASARVLTGDDSSTEVDKTNQMYPMLYEDVKSERMLRTCPRCDPDLSAMAPHDEGMGDIGRST